MSRQQEDDEAKLAGAAAPLTGFETPIYHQPNENIKVYSKYSSEIARPVGLFSPDPQVSACALNFYEPHTGPEDVLNSSAAATGAISSRCSSVTTSKLSGIPFTIWEGQYDDVGKENIDPIAKKNGKRRKQRAGAKKSRKGRKRRVLGDITPKFGSTKAAGKSRQRVKAKRMGLKTSNTKPLLSVR